MNDKARNRIESARERIQEGDNALREQFRSDSFTERLAAIANLLGRSSYPASLCAGWGWDLVSECFCHLESLPEPVVVRERGRLVDLTPVTIQRREPLQMLAHALGLPDEEHDAAWSVVGGAWRWLCWEVEALQRMETPREVEAA